MGQLEKYGLYVLCLVIFLILGVALWGEPAPVHAGGTNASGAMLQLNGGGAVAEPGKTTAPVKQVLADDDLMHQMLEQPKPPKDDKPPANAKNGGKEQPKPAAEPSAPSDSKRQTYKVVDGDVLSTIAQKQLGSMRYVDAILKLNPKVDPRRLKVGDELLLPSKAELGQTAAQATDKTDKAPAGSRTHTVVDGDTYEAISVKLFKSKNRVADIEKLNPGVDPRRLRVGTKILVPVE